MIYRMKSVVVADEYVRTAKDEECLLRKSGKQTDLERMRKKPPPLDASELLLVYNSRYKRSTYVGSRFPINEYKSWLSVARERGSLIRRFYDGGGTILYYITQEICPHSSPAPSTHTNTPLYPFFKRAQCLCMPECLCKQGFQPCRDIRCKFHQVTLIRYEKRPSPNYNTCRPEILIYITRYFIRIQHIQSDMQRRQAKGSLNSSDTTAMIRFCFRRIPLKWVECFRYSNGSLLPIFDIPDVYTAHVCYSTKMKLKKKMHKYIRVDKIKH